MCGDGVLERATTLRANELVVLRSSFSIMPFYRRRFRGTRRGVCALWRACCLDNAAPLPRWRRVKRTATPQRTDIRDNMTTT